MAGMTTLAEIKSVHWQPALNSDGVVEGEADIDQCIQTILGTPKGSVPHRPGFGSDVYLYVDYPIPTAIPHVVRESADAIRQWEPRCELVKVIPLVDAEHLTVRVQWKLSDGVVRQTDVVVR